MKLTPSIPLVALLVVGTAADQTAKHRVESHVDFYEEGNVKGRALENVKLKLDSHGNRRFLRGLNQSAVDPNNIEAMIVGGT
jgi:hypothetical protein